MDLLEIDPNDISEPLLFLDLEYCLPELGFIEDDTLLGSSCKRKKTKRKRINARTLPWYSALNKDMKKSGRVLNKKEKIEFSEKYQIKSHQLYDMMYEIRNDHEKDISLLNERKQAKVVELQLWQIKLRDGLFEHGYTFSKPDVDKFADKYKITYCQVRDKMYAFREKYPKKISLMNKKKQ